MPTPILTTKLYLPPPRPDAVLRSRLIARLNAGLHHKLALICAPAGFGKTTLLSAWLADCGRPVAWLSLDEGDSDTTRFLSYLVAALQTITPTIGTAVLGLLQSAQPPIEAILTALLNDITILPDTLLLVLDDYHLIDAKPVDTALTFLLDHLPSRLRLLVSGRAQLAILDIHDLALARERGRDLVAVMSIVQRPLAAVLANPGVDSPRDLEGRKVGVTGLPSDDAVLRSIVTGAGGDPDAVERVTIGFDAVPALLGGRVAGATAFWNVEGVALSSARPGVHDFRVDAYGAPPYPELVLVTTRARLREDPALVRATVRALVRGYGVTVHDPASSLNDLASRVRGLDREQLQRQLDVLVPALSPAGGRIGGLDPQVLARWAAWEARFGIVDAPPDVGRLFDTRVVPDSGAASDDAG